MTENPPSGRFEGSSPAIRPLPKVGQELGKFIIERELPRGGQARVFRAWQTDLSRPVALKILPPSFADDNEALVRFRREVENVARVSHPNIVRIFEAGELEGYPYFTMEYLDGDDCETLLRRGPMSAFDAASIMEAISRAVAEAHHKGIVHRDIKPGNVIVRENQTPVLTDFGLAQDVTKSAQLTQTGVSMGTPAYMSPEQARGERHRVGKKSDIYSLGATLYTLLTGKRPADGASAYEVMVAAAEMQGPQWPREALEQVPADLRAIVETAMQNDPAKRYESAGALAEDLERFMRGDWVNARSQSWLSKSWHKVKRYAAVSAVIVVSAGLSAGLIVSSMLDPTGLENRPRNPFIEKPIWPDEKESAEKDAQALSDKWVIGGAVIDSMSGSERVYARVGEEPIRLAYRDGICWGDFEIETLFTATDVKGEVSLLIGVPSDGKSEPAYRVVIGAQAANRYEIRRLGKPLAAGNLLIAGPAFAPGSSYRALIVRTGESLRFELHTSPTDILLASATLDDAQPALHSGRDRFALEADARTLVVRGVSVRHRESQYSRETVLFLDGSYASAQSPLSAKLAAPTDPLRKNERAQLLFMYGRCLEAAGRDKKGDAAKADFDAALNAYGEAKFLAQESRLRARVFLQSALLEARLGRDDNALVQLSAARNNADAQNDLASGVYLQTLYFGLALAESGEGERLARQQRALRYLSWVSDNSLRDGFTVCDAQYESARLRLEIAQGGAPDAKATRARALEDLRMISKGNYRDFGRVYGPALALLFNARRADFELKPEWSEDADSPSAEMLELALKMAEGAGAFMARFDDTEPALARASWLARMSGKDGQAASLLATCERYGKGETALWARTQILLMAEERQLDNSPSRAAAWGRLAEDLDKAPRSPSSDAMLALAKYFSVDPPDEQALRRWLRDYLGKVPTYWYGDCDVRTDAFVNYCVGLRKIGQKRKEASALLERAASEPSAGWLRLLSKRVEKWLPPERPNG